MPGKTFPIAVSKQATPIVLGRPIVRDVRVRRGTLTSEQMRRLSQEGIPGICKTTLIDQAIAGIGWEIMSPSGKADATTEYYTMLIKHSNDGEGAGPFLMRFADDILSTLQGGHFEATLGPKDIPVALYSVDSTSIYPNVDFPKEDPDHPWEQRYMERPPILFRRNELSHAYWHPTTSLDEIKRNRCPIEMAYYFICILAATDDWNLDLVGDPFPAGVLALAGASREEAEAFKVAWDHAIEGGKLHDLAVIYGFDLKQAQHIKFTRPPTDMAFEITNHWYASLVAAAYEMSILDISILTRVSTKAGAESQERLSAQQGQRKLRKVVGEALEEWVLPEGYKWNWIVPKPEDEVTQAEAAERRAHAASYYIMSLGPDAGLEIARQEGLLRAEGAIPQQVEHLKSDAAIERLVIQADLLGYMSLEVYERLQDAVMERRANAPPPHLWGYDLYEWVQAEYDRTLLLALEMWLDEVEDDPELAAMHFQERYHMALQRSAVRAYVAGKQQDAEDEDDALLIAAVALTLAELSEIDDLISDNVMRFRKFAEQLAADGLDYETKVTWRTQLYAHYLRRFFLMGITAMANPLTDLIRIAHGTSVEPCGVCPLHWGDYTVEEYEVLEGPPPAWCEGWDNCTCQVTILRGARLY